MDLLGQNAGFPARLKWTAGLSDPAPSLRIDLISGLENPAPYLASAEVALAGASVPAAGTEDPAIDCEELTEMISEAGWESRPSPNDTGTLQIPLGIAGAAPARMGNSPGGAIEIRFDYPTGNREEAPSEVEEARVRLLLCLAKEIRLVVPALDREKGGFHLRAGLSGTIEAECLRHALGALSYAVSGSIREFEALGDPELAHAYLKLLAIPSRGRNTKPQT